MYQNIYPSNMSIDLCLNQCAAFGYPAAGAEFGDECCELFPVRRPGTAILIARQGVVTSRISNLVLDLHPRATAISLAQTILFTCVVALHAFRYV